MYEKNDFSFHMGKKTCYSFFQAWLISFNIISSSFIQIDTNYGNFIFYGWIIFHWIQDMLHFLSFHLSTNIVDSTCCDNTIINMGIQISLWYTDFISFRNKNGKQWGQVNYMAVLLIGFAVSERSILFSKMAALTVASSFSQSISRLPLRSVIRHPTYPSTLSALPQKQLQGKLMRTSTMNLHAFKLWLMHTGLKYARKPYDS